MNFIPNSHRTNLNAATKEKQHKFETCIKLTENDNLPDIKERHINQWLESTRENVIGREKQKEEEEEDTIGICSDNEDDITSIKNLVETNAISLKAFDLKLQQLENDISQKTYNLKKELNDNLFTELQEMYKRDQAEKTKQINKLKLSVRRLRNARNAKTINKHVIEKLNTRKKKSRNAWLNIAAALGSVSCFSYALFYTITNGSISLLNIGLDVLTYK